ncbi:hypothetical protein L6V77_32520 [Myxococcota bacterium]|nr:hypothetical protein [Myxococcota bacterium]
MAKTPRTTMRAHSALLYIALLAAACGDDGATGGGKTPDAGPTGGTAPDASGGSVGGSGGDVGGSGGAGGETGGTGGTGGQTGGAGGQTGGSVPDASVPDAAELDAALPDMNVAVPDAALDAAIPDAYVPTPADAGAACEPGDPDQLCGPFSQCLDAVCRPDITPGVFRMASANILAPATASDALTAAIQVALSTSPPAINFLIEPAGYAEAGYRFNVGNGRPLVAGNPEAGFVFNHQLPIQNVYGTWLNDMGTLRYEQNGTGRFTIFAPGRTIQNGAGQNVTCWNEIGATVQVSVEPRFDDAGDLYVRAIADGFMSVTDANEIVFYVGAQPIPLSQFLENEPIVDADGDGIENEYFFTIEIDALPITLNDNNPAREPEQVPEQDPACENP